MSANLASSSVNTLQNPDGSATHTALGYTIVGSINGPIEVSRRDELPEEVTLEVNIRPAEGVGTPRDRHLESFVHSTLRRIILTRDFPRTLIQLTLQILRSPISSTPSHLPSSLRHSTLPLLPALLTTALLSLLAANIPLCTTISPVLAFAYTLSSKEKRGKLLLVDNDSSSLNNSIEDIVGQDRGKVSALHLFAFGQAGELLLTLSEGDFAPEEWDEACKKAEEWVTRLEGDEDMDVDNQERRGETERQFLLHAVKG